MTQHDCRQPIFFALNHNVLFMRLLQSTSKYSQWNSHLFPFQFQRTIYTIWIRHCHEVYSSGTSGKISEFDYDACQHNGFQCAKLSQTLWYIHCTFVCKHPWQTWQPTLCGDFLGFFPWFFMIVLWWRQPSFDIACSISFKTHVECMYLFHEEGWLYT